MMLLPCPEVICTHESDLDGLVSGLLLQRLARHVYSMEVPLEAYNYQAWRSRRMAEDAAWVADFTLESRLDKPGWMLVDHHTTTFRPRCARAIHDTTKSASLLCYGLLCEHGLGSPVLDRLVHLANVGDLFVESDPDFELACDCGSLVKAYGFWDLHSVIGGVAEAILGHPLLEVMATRRRVEDPIGLDLALRGIVEISPEVAMVRAPVGNTNLIVHKILNQRAVPHPVVVSLHRRGNGSYVASFRSLKGEALAVATRFEGGGGHPNAAGATLPKLNSLEAAIDHLRARLAPGGGQRHGLQSMSGSFGGLQWPGEGR
jgi:hypothetical protein